MLQDDIRQQLRYWRSEKTVAHHAVRALVLGEVVRWFPIQKEGLP